jgi:hypothetical protein
LKIRTLVLSAFFFSALLICFQMPVTVADPDIYLKRFQASGVTTNPGLLMDFSAPSAQQPASLTTVGGVEYFWYSAPYVGTILGPKPHAFHLYYQANAPTVITVTVCIAVQADGGGAPALVSSKTYPLEAALAVRRITIPDVVTIPQTTLNGERIKLSLNTDQPVTIYFDGAATPSVLNTISPPGATVGGVIISTNTITILAPYFAAIGLVTTTAVAVKKRRT